MPTANLIIHSGAGDPPIENAFGIPFAVRSPRSATFVTLVINPGVEAYEDQVDTPPGLEITNYIAWGYTDETVEVVVDVGEVRHFAHQGTEYTLTLLSATLGPAGPADWTYAFLVEPVDPSGTETHAARRQACRDLSKAYASNPTPTAEQVLAYATDLEHRASRDMMLDDEGASNLAHAWHRKTAALLQLKQYAEAAEVAARLIDTFRTHPHGYVKKCVAEGVLYRGAALDYLGRPDEALQHWAELEAGYGGVTGADDIAWLVAAANAYTGTVHAKAGRFAEARASWQRVVERYGAVTNTRVAAQVGAANDNLARLTKMGH